MQFIIEIEAPLYKQKYSFLEDKVIYEWVMSPLHKGKRTCPRDVFRGDLAEAEVFGHDAARNLWPAAISMLIGLVLLSGFENQIVQYLSVPLFIFAFFELILVAIKLRKEKWIYLLNHDGTFELSFCENYIKNMSKEEFRSKYKEYTSFNNKHQPTGVNTVG